ncbi:HEAT repeat domain-containing protein [Paenibacillus sacheonensis]|uniref:Phytanoyl-CoA dioxygenase n=1 Tax=Paenibacillus sacheonensis TaxID=742054 RepID=A0A7X4YR70_9BACL|nr:HEAT repeat domain-containing protein [Paenibacillus sacheonensis]MBM7563627.1 HEAT repeat protein [Paenibacillus sacheonensis]NBC71077.1 phytanoyl-CoA dioxygenase [Paenibacillus sacheonensis]
MTQQPLLLNDEQMKSFIANGFLILKTDFSREFHEKLVSQLNEIYDKEGNPGNNILPRIRDLQRVFEHPVITGALTSVLGPEYLLHTHRHGHYNSIPKPGGWHKDSYWGYSKLRNHHPWWAMIMYFPQDTPMELGPTGVLPGTHFEDSRNFASDEMAEEATAKGEAGTFALIHYDIWHRSTPNLLGNPRFMLKFEFMRTQAPAAPSWNNQAQEIGDITEVGGRAVYQPVADEVWNWLSGRVAARAGSKAGSAEEVAELASRLNHAEEPEAIAAAYDLAASGEAGIGRLLEALNQGPKKISRIAAYGLSAAGTEAVAGLTQALTSSEEYVVNHALFALSELRGQAEAAVPQVAALIAHPSDVIRRTVAEVLGMMSSNPRSVVPALIQALSDEDTQVKFTAGLALVRIGPDAADAVPALEASLDDENRYVRGHALEALRSIGTKEAHDVLMRELFNTRWCSDTTPASTF